jgi:hypothetical protein
MDNELRDISLYGQLEELIEDQLDKAYEAAGPNAYFGSGFNRGSEYVLSLDLPVKFAEWLNKKGFVPFDDESWECLTPKGQVIEKTKTLYKFWLNNVYDGK